MRPRLPTSRAVSGLLLLVFLPAWAGCADAATETPPPPADAEAPAQLGHADLPLDFEMPDPAAGSDTIPGTPWTRTDWAIFEEVVREAVAAGADRAPLGEAIGAIGRGFVGFPYTPQTIEAPWVEGRGVEELVVNLREFDCVTFVENTLALTWFVRNEGVEALSDPAAARAAYEGYLTGLRYRGGDLDGYASRLHYFSEWLADNAARGRLALVTGDELAVEDTSTINFMSAHVEAYPALAADPAEVARIRAMEAALAASLPRSYIPEDRIADFADRIRTGDVIAATSTVPGLDVAHTGIALRVGGELRLMHAPLVGSVVEVSEVPLADRILRIEGQDGIMVGRPLPVR